jgi:hypothetical protein
LRKPRFEDIAAPEDLALLGWTLITVIAAWIVMPGFSLLKPLMSNDGIYISPRIFEALQIRSWSGLTYRADTLGGVAFADIYGKPALYILLSWFKVSVETAMNCAVILTQVSYGFLGAKAAISLQRRWSGSTPTRVPTPAKIGLALLTAFVPIVGARVQYGHLESLWGLELFLILLSIGLSLQANDFTRTQLTVIFLTFLHAIPALGQQTKTYSVVFGGIILLPLFWTGPHRQFKAWAKARQKQIVHLSLAALGATLAVVPAYYGMLRFALSSDPARGFGRESIVYSYPGTEFVNWVASLSWNYKLFQTTQNPILITEFFFPFGPLLLFLFCLWKKSRAAVIGALISLTLGILFSLKVEPVATLLQTLIPVLKMFRIPERSVMPFCLVLPIFASALLLGESPQKTSTTAAWVGVGGLILLALLPPMGREILLWSVAIALLVLIHKKSSHVWWSVSTALLFFGVGSVISFSAWLQQAPAPSASMAHLRELGDTLKERKPELSSHLNRVHFNFMHPEHNVMTPVASRLSSVAGYWHPLQRFSEMYAALNNTKYESTAVYFNITPKDPAWPTLIQLYNVCCEVSLDAEKKVRLNPMMETAGPAWFSSKVAMTTSITEVAALLKSRIHLPPLEFVEVLPIVTSDGKVPAQDLQSKDISVCKAARIKTPVDMGSDRQSFSVTVESPNTCPLTFAMNYSEMLRARAQSDSGAQDLQVFPGFGSLATAMIPQGTYAVEIWAEPYDHVALRWLGWIGFLIFGLALWQLPRSKLELE